MRTRDALAPARAFALPLALAALAVLVACATPVAAYPNHTYPCDIAGPDGVCVGDVQYGACGESSQSDSVTGVALKFDGQYVADVGGVAQCDSGPDGFSRRATVVYVETRYATFAWAEEQRENDEGHCAEYACDPEGCSWWLYYPGNFARVDCAAVGAPPNPGWGHVLP